MSHFKILGFSFYFQYVFGLMSICVVQQDLVSFSILIAKSQFLL